MSPLPTTSISANDDGIRAAVPVSKCRSNEALVANCYIPFTFLLT